MLPSSIDPPTTPAAAAAAAGRADVIDAGFLGEVAAGQIAIAPRPAVLDTAAVACSIAKALLAAAHHGADAAEQKRAADHTRCGRRRGSEERAAATTGHRRRLLRAVAALLAAAILAGTLALLHHLAAVPNRAIAHAGRADIRHRALRALALILALVLTEDRIAHRIEEPAWLALLRRAALELLDTLMGTPERLVLHQRGLHQRVDRIRGRA